ncbi:MAG: hypothetical protein CVV46_07635 [Spirochaetae bacterium HGW-Spirochaetae-2]|jgi:hypothetical protein|nr:MAG: hypothetical protein CVV46_07635 [Spirochaetae bacterium HGW-Spirochaetae-2]
MKKAIAILLVLLVAGVAFGADTLTLESVVTGVLKHGFISSEIADVTFANISTGVGAAGVDNSITGIDFLEDDDQDVGYYYFASNTANTGYKVSFVVNPFSSTTTGVNFKVPYTLNMTGTGNSTNVTLTTAAISTTGTLGGTITASSPVDVIATPSNAVSHKYAGLALSITVDGTGNETYGLPADTYVGSVVATVTTH